MTTLELRRSRCSLRCSLFFEIYPSHIRYIRKVQNNVLWFYSVCMLCRNQYLLLYAKMAPLIGQEMSERLFLQVRGGLYSVHYSIDITFIHVTTHKFV